MSKRWSVSVAHAGKVKVPAKPPTVNSLADEIRVLNLEKNASCVKKLYLRSFKPCSLLHLLIHNKLTKT